TRNGGLATASCTAQRAGAAPLALSSEGRWVRRPPARLSPRSDLAAVRRLGARPGERFEGRVERRFGEHVCERAQDVDAGAEDGVQRLLGAVAGFDKSLPVARRHPAL